MHRDAGSVHLYALKYTGQVAGNEGAIYLGVGIMFSSTCRLAALSLGCRLCCRQAAGA